MHEPRRTLYLARAVGAALLGAAMVVGCNADDDGGDDTAAATMGATVGSESGADETAGNANAQPTVEAVVDPAAACGADGSLLLRATLIGCVSPPPAPCTVPMVPPTFESSAVACPSTDAEGPLRVEIDTEGRYAIQLVTVAADATEAATCYASADGPELVIDETALMDKPTIPVTESGGSCL